jgi:SSS family transporter
MHAVDILIYVCYFGALGAVGLHFARRQSSLQDFVRGKHQLGPIALGFTLMAALNSATDYIQTPAIIFAFGTVYIALVLTWIPLYFWVTRVTIPFYQRLNVYSAYEYLEQRFGVSIRLIAAATFVLWRIGWMAVALYVPCLAVGGTEASHGRLSLMIIGLGSVVTAYTVLGGMKAVIWTDLIQFFVMFAGLFATLAFTVWNVPGGVREVFHVAQEGDRLRLFANVSVSDGSGVLAWLRAYFTTDITFVGIIACILVGRLAAFTSDQVAIQRLQSSRGPKEAKDAFISNAISDAVWMIVLGCVGLALFAYFKHFSYPTDLRNDQVLPYFMSQRFPAGLTGLVNAAIIAASLSSVGAALNSATSVLVIDFYNRLWLGHVRPTSNHAPAEQRRQIFISRCINAILGITMVVIALNIERMGEIYVVANKILGAFFGVLFGIFVLGMFSQRANSAIVVMAAGCGLVVSCFLSFFSIATSVHQPFALWFGRDASEFFKHLSWQWPPVFGLATMLLVGTLLGRLRKHDPQARGALTFREVRGSAQT